MTKMAKWSAWVMLSSLLGCKGEAGFSSPPSPPPPPPPPSGPAPVGVPEVRDLGNFHSALLGNNHQIRVYLPSGYATGSDHYPVLYIQDGETAFGGNMKFDVVATALIEAQAIRPLIMVAIYAAPNRDTEYVPWTGTGVTYARMMTEELKPAIDAQFRTLTGPDDTGVTGYSLGGVITWYLGLFHTNTFHLMAAQSGALSTSDTLLLRTARALPSKLPLRIWYDRGTNDGEAKNQVLEGLMHQTLVDHGWVEGIDLRYLLVPGATHSVTSFSQRVDPLLRFLFSK